MKKLIKRYILEVYEVVSNFDTEHLQKLIDLREKERLYKLNLYNKRIEGE